jgi:hypothetical protein
MAMLNNQMVYIYLYIYICTWLVVDLPWKIWKSVGMTFPIYGKVKNVPNHQPDTYRYWFHISGGFPISRAKNHLTQTHDSTSNPLHCHHLRSCRTSPSPSPSFPLQVSTKHPDHQPSDARWFRGWTLQFPADFTSQFLKKKRPYWNDIWHELGTGVLGS